ncbi:hypothetical protein DTO207G8_8271 [Paecilomyces variotii]|nr:hypothetical protein DTO207G8_8271 [Paecilomyces variotii]
MVNPPKAPSSPSRATVRSSNVKFSLFPRDFPCSRGVTADGGHWGLCIKFINRYLTRHELLVRPHSESARVPVASVLKQA